MEEGLFLAGRDLGESGGFVKFGRDLADQFVDPDALADSDLERLTDGLADDKRNVNRRFPRPGQVKIAFVDGGLLHVGGEVLSLS